MEIKIFEKLQEDSKYIRRKVFMEEQGFENEFDELDRVCTHILIYESDNAVATCRFYYNEKRQCYAIGRIAVLKEFRGKNYGAELLKAAEGEIMKMQGNCSELSAQVRVAGFYEKNGYVALDEIYDDEGCVHVWMRKELR